MPITLAQVALKYAKNCTPLGPDNQGVGQLSPPKAWNPGRDPMTRQQAKLGMNAVREMQPHPGCSMNEIVSYGREVMKHKAGNCFEQCAAACLYLAGSLENPVYRLVHLEAPGDHIFVVLDQLTDVNNVFPDDFNNWAVNAVIVDPWVGICVKARNYPEVWRLKLDVMGASGEELASAAGWTPANANYWSTAPNAHRKLSYTQ